MQYNFRDDLKAIRAILGLTQAELASKIGIERITISRNELGKTTPSVKLLEQIYSFAFKNSIKLNKLKEAHNHIRDEKEELYRQYQILKAIREESAGY